MPDANRLPSYVETWAQAVTHSVALARSLGEDDRSRPLDVDVTIEGDQSLARRALDSMALTP